MQAKKQTTRAQLPRKNKNLQEKLICLFVFISNYLVNSLC